jgi:hypothetical protein
MFFKFMVFKKPLEGFSLYFIKLKLYVNPSPCEQGEGSSLLDIKVFDLFGVGLDKSFAGQNFLAH